MRNQLICAALILIVGAILLSGCREFDQNAYLSERLGVDVSRGTVQSSRNSHGGFHGDGLLEVTISFTQEQAETMLAQLSGLPGWKPLPVTENLTKALYGKSVANHRWNPLIWHESPDEVLVPEIRNGWYYFFDRHSEAMDPLDDGNLFSRGSYNFTVAVFDTDTMTLYFYELDT